MRIAVLAYTFYDSDSRVMRYAEALAERGDHVDVFALNAGLSPEYEVMRGVNLFRIQQRDLNERHKYSYLFRLMRFFFKSMLVLTRKHISKPYDLVHVHSVPDFEIFAAFFAKLKGAKIILDIHDIVPEFYASKFNKPYNSMVYKTLINVERVSAMFANHVIISNHLWRDLLLSRSVSNQKCSVVLNYPDQSIFFKRAEKVENSKVVMIYPGSLNFHQGLDIAIRAFSKIKPSVPNAEFHIFGEGSERPALLKLINNLGIGNNICLRNSISLFEVADVMRHCQIGVVPKRNDPFGGQAFSTKILEFMCVGVPVIAAATTIDKYYFSDAVVRFFEPENEESLSNAMLELIQNPGLRETLAANASKFVEDFTWGKRKHEYLDLVDGLVNRR
jgi:glycosyltransferase involved in cell wall biosynthesis